jgi:hypothetical protein
MENLLGSGACPAGLSSVYHEPTGIPEGLNCENFRDDGKTETRESKSSSTVHIPKLLIS